MKLKTFYAGLAVVAVGGAAAIWWTSRSNAADAAAAAANVGPIDTTALFPGYPMGNPDAPVEIIEYGDFVCPVCGNFAVITEPDIRERLVQTGRVHWIFRDRPLNIPGHQNAVTAHLAAACANEQGKFWDMHDQLFFNQAAWGEEGGVERKLRGYAEAIHLDMDKYNACMASDRYGPRIRASAAAADKAGITATPTFLINNHLVAGGISYDSMKTLVDVYTPPPPKPAPAKAPPAKAPGKASTKSKS